MSARGALHAHHVVWQAQQKMHITISADLVDCKQRIRFNRAPVSADEMAMIEALKALGYTWSGYSDTGKWQGNKDTVGMWNDVVWRRRA